MPWPKLRKSPAIEGEEKPAPRVKVPSAEQRMQRLARKLDEIPAKDGLRIEQAREVERKQNAAGAELHHLCRSFVKRLNGILTKLQLEFTPEEYSPASLDGPTGSIFQINANGRIIQISVLSKEAAISTEHYRIPYILEGRVRWFNQELLDRQEIQEAQIFYCVEGSGDFWRYHDPRTRNSGKLSHEFLMQALEQIV